MKKLIPLLYVLLLFSYSDIIAQSAGRQYDLLSKALQDYEKIKDKEDWTPISLGDKSALKLHDQEPVIKDIKKRLSVLGDYRAMNHNDVFTAKLEEAVRSFQERHGLEPDGVIGPGFLKELNTPIENRIRQIQVNMDRLMRENTEASGRHIVANIPEFKLYVYEGNREALSMDIVVGKTTNKTVVFSDVMKHIVFSPYWNVPESIVRNEILPAIKRNPRYLRMNQMEIVGNKDGIPEIRQKPGAKNALGRVKFMFPNQYNIYFHDTPAKSLFERNKRAFSHGCIRVSQPFELAKYLLKDQREWTDDAIKKAMYSGTEKWVNLEQPVPVSISYYTAWVDSDGEVNFREDIYGHDKEMANSQ
ncbi:murein L,D-transpeptidase [Pedobacter sp. SYSU D00535]|uniref:L,D-transpeptidase family protein n=1 Tax=Pedobacter sp. SYSU D00535 TaxID=2810308 RepID=UPI001A95BDF0|nr:L,D-transpeptidase family protein [Pedobacter sp. SYSU D00535]